LPAPDGPRIRQAATVHGDTTGMKDVAGRGHTGRPTTKRAPKRFRGRVGGGGPDVLGPDHPAMRLDDLLGDGEAKARMLAELGLRALGIEPLEDLGQRLFGMPGPVSSTTISTRFSRRRAQTRTASPSRRRKSRS
jgi:hypothetical protein